MFDSLPKKAKIIVWSIIILLCVFTVFPTFVLIGWILRMRYESRKRKVRTGMVKPMRFRTGNKPIDVL